VYEEVIELPEKIDAEQVVRTLIELVEKALRESQIPRDRLLGIGIGAPGRVDTRLGEVIHYGRISGMTHFSIKSPVEAAFDLPVYVHNNASVIALSEYRYGVAQGQETLLTILIRSGVGGAFINQGTIFLTKQHTTMEIGHMTVDMEGRRCACGGRGCLETYLSEDAVLGDLQGSRASKDVEALDQSLAEQEGETERLLRQKAVVLGEGIRSLFQLFGPDSFLIVTRSQALSEFLARETAAHLEAISGQGNGSRARMLAASYNPIMAGKGAADLVLDHFFT
jgi:predicted NBD/HSP70 family sugar kinase